MCVCIILNICILYQPINIPILAYGSNLLAYMAHAVAKPCKKFFHRLKKTFTYLELVSVDGACGSTLLAYAAYAVANC